MTNLVDKSCESVEWWTPDRVLDPVREYFSGIVMDPATAPSNLTGADHFCTAEDNGLERNWDDGTFLNPPYGPQMRDWLAKLKEESLVGHEIIALLPGSRWEQQYFQESVFNEGLCGFCLVRKRLRFINGNTGEVCPSNPYASLIYGYNLSRWEEFRDIFSTIGTVVRTDEMVVHEE